MPLLQLQLPTACCAAAASAPFSFSRPPPSRLRASHVIFAFPRLRKYGRRSREPVPTTLDDDEDEEADEDDDDGVEEAVDEDIFLKNRPKPAGFGVGKTYTTDVEEQLLREMGLGGAGRKSKSAPPKSVKTNGSATETSADVSDDGVHVRIWNLPKKKNIHKDLNLAFKGFPGLVTINPANSGTKKTRDPICKGFAFVKLESVDAATRFVELYSRKAVSFGKVEKPIKCCIVEGHASTDPSGPASSSQAPGSNPQRLVAVR
ncbi:uncharacterized protein LOC123413491 [Hordeum vulgare subsp. vulgare]|uniref:Predicted protein n=1 Tax=Hordeum vulgare subsp. vulgare TaxID=112509 RepID=F2DWB4_HORVV|nr:uncharacterized protein LOC123413491 [Hordeum vulgare subsp. vulgare]BAJ99385.1 predicted protein [Hordeum vulgare subsp. vulgare]